MSSLRDKAILHIDDSADTRFLARKILESDGAICFETDSGALGIDLARSKNPHLILLDLRMPQMDGFAVLSKLRADPGTREIPVIVLSGEADSALVRRALALGARDYLLKPFKNILLLQKARKALHNQEFKKYVFPAEQKPSVLATVAAEITSSDESGFMIRSSVRIGAQSPVVLKSALIDELGFGQHRMRSGELGRYAEEGQYNSSIQLIGISGEDAKNLRISLMTKVGK